jgi:hypothetical protein
MATLTSCSTSASQLVMNDVEPSTDFIAQRAVLSALASTIDFRNGQFSTFSSGDVFSSSNYLKIKKLAIQNNLIAGATGNCTPGFVNGALLGASVPQYSTLEIEINKILAKG